MVTFNICCSFLLLVLVLQFFLCIHVSVNIVHVLKLSSSCLRNLQPPHRMALEKSYPNLVVCLINFFSRQQRFDTNEEMVAHQAKHLTESKYKCELCGKHFPSQSSVWKHTKAHSGERPFVW